MKKEKRNLQSHQEGQGLMEYMIISALIGIFCLTVVGEYGETIKTRINQMKKKVVDQVKIQ